MTPRNRAFARTLLAALAFLGAALCQPPLPALGAGGGSSGLGAAPPSSSGSGGASVLGGGLAPVASAPSHVPAPPSKRAKGNWLKGVAITEYWPAPESWFVGAMVTAPRLPGLHRIDWLYSAAGISMQGSGIGLDGRTYHIDALGDGGWVTLQGTATSPADAWSAGAPYWRAGGYWRNTKQQVTFPLGAGGWSNGTGTKYVALRRVTFAAGASQPLRYDESIAVDPRVIPMGSRVYVPAYRGDGHGGWFLAQDTGGAINGRHIDVYRSPPASPLDLGTSLTSQRIFVIKPRH
ncbi:MAG TPA: 3D domain-containing protein [Solirubrobacteraceae bacterium]|jgi:3D (Asp-Asp-Asp) domain-containing protein